jgi:hypothetical protein
MSIKNNNFFWEQICDLTSDDEYNKVMKVNQNKFLYMSDEYITVASSPYRAINYTNTWVDKILKIRLSDINYASKGYYEQRVEISYKVNNNIIKIEFEFDDLCDKFYNDITLIVKKNNNVIM